MTNKSTVEKNKLTAAFERLKVNASQIMKRGTKVSISSVQMEAMLPSGSLSKDNYPKLFAEVKAYKETTIDRLTAAFERLKIDDPIIKDKGTKVSVLTVQQEAGFSKGTITKQKHSDLHTEINAYKDNLKVIKDRKDGLEALSKEESFQSKYNVAERRRKKYYNLMMSAKDELVRHQEKEVMVLQAMFEMLDVHSKAKLTDAGNNGVSEKQPLKYESIKKKKENSNKNHLKQVK